MKKHILLLFSIFLFIALTVSPKSVFSQGFPTCGAGGGQVFDFSLSSSTVQAGSELTVTINSSNLDGGYFVVVGPVNTGTNVQPLASSPITINQNGVGTVSFTIPETSPNGSQTVLIASSINPLETCAGGGTEVFIEGQAPPPPPGEDCRNVGESCIEGVTPLCSPETSYCDMTGGGVPGGGLVRQTGIIGSRCVLSGSQYVCADGVPTSQDAGCTCQQEQLAGPTEGTAALVGCNGVPGTVDTAIGCIPFDLINRTATFFISWSLAIGGGVALLLIGVSGIMFATSSGIPQKVESAKSLFFAATTGLGMLVLSVFLLRFIGVDLLGLFS